MSDLLTFLWMLATLPVLAGICILAWGILRGDLVWEVRGFETPEWLNALAFFVVGTAGLLLLTTGLPFLIFVLIHLWG